MADKMECPACEAYLSSVLGAYREGRPCPNCGLPAETAAKVIEARERGANAELTERYTQAELRAGEAEAEARWLRSKLERIERILAEKQPDPKDAW